MPPFRHHTGSRRRPCYLIALSLLSGFILWFALADHANITPPPPLLRFGDKLFESLPSRPTLYEYTALTRAQMMTMLGTVGEVEQRFVLRETNGLAGYEELRIRIEETLLLGKLLDRAPVLPEAVWVTECTSETKACSTASLQYLSSRNDHETELGGKWPTPGEAWLLEIHDFLDLPHLRKCYGAGAVTLDEFLSFHLLNRTLIRPDGNLDLDAASVALKVSPLNTFSFDTSAVLVDRVDEEKVGEVVSGIDLIKGVSEAALGEKTLWTFEEVINALSKKGWKLPGDYEKAIAQLAMVGVLPLYSSESHQSHAVIPQLLELTSSVKKLQSLSTLLSSQSAPSSILHLAGAFPNSGLRFSSIQGRAEFENIVTKCIRPPKEIREVAASVVKAMKMKARGKRWIGVHLLPSSSAEKDQTLLTKSTSIAISRMEFYAPAQDLPNQDDPYFLVSSSTDSQPSNAVTLTLLLTPADLRKLGWQAGFPALLSLVEHQVLTQADYFLGSKQSVFSGGVVNSRIGRVGEEDSWSWL